MDLNSPPDMSAAQRRKRVITAARKEQNRLAQRAFRQRQKDKLHGQAGDPPRNEGRGRAVDKARRLGLVPSKEAGSERRAPLSSATLPTPPYGEFRDLTVVGVTQSDPIQPSDPTTALPDPMVNAVRLLPTQFFSACLHNARALKIDLDSFAYCQSSCQSPFYRPSTPQDNPTSLLSSTHNRIGPDAPPSLRPTLTQILIPHHACLDLIPLPSFRDQAIILSAAMPFTFNVWELKLDIYEKGGLTCLGTGKPWEKGSWEAEPWFLRKWSVVVAAEKDNISERRTSRCTELRGDSASVAT